ncbi:MAG TPA: nicotinamide riboside transporter PnuC [Thermoanaerobaculia bacterium]
MRKLFYAVAVVVSVALIAASWLKWLPFSLTETFGFVTGAWCVYFVTAQNIWNFPLGIANNVLFFFLFYRSAIYGDAWLQVIYLILNAHGWYWWLRGGEEHTERRVSKAPLVVLVATAVGVIAGTWVLEAILRAVSGAAPLIDAFTTTLSLAAQVLMNYKYLENWYVWIAADIIYIYLYITRGLQLTAVLYFIFMGLCVIGLVRWRKALTI